MKICKNYINGEWVESVSGKTAPTYNPANGEILAEVVQSGLEAIQAKYPTVIEEVRGVGMMMAVEFFSDEYGYEFSKEMYNQHVIISGTLNNSKSIRFEPPVSLTPEEIAKILDASDKAAAKVKKVFGL